MLALSEETHLSYRSWLGIGEQLLQAHAPHKTCPSNFLPVPSIQQDGYDSDPKANSESESEATSDFGTEFKSSSHWMNLELD